ncbi:NTP transferase domain-containing protein [uncultured Desulfosarcina sp.]|uniref:NTP transferase domain-containing protein n=1 Tax=uncultured Desulfosarcina sp. TaxID=218289 RepID=UPI0029C8C8C6|nr:NTP transferase domain-containing protein [uncultured Desulfosarcina sp.]
MGSNSKKIPAACLILAGGKGRRLTPDKPLLEINNRAIIERTVQVVRPLFEEVLLVTNTPAKYEFLRLPVVRDERQGCGPLMGIYSGLRGIKHEVAFVCAADMPFLDEQIIRSQFRELGAFDIVFPCPRERPEFLHAFYRRQCLPAIRDNLDAAIFKIEMLVPRCTTLRLDKAWFAKKGLAERVDRAFTNINTMRDYRRWLEQGSRTLNETPGSNILASIVPGVLQEIRRTLIEQETAFQDKSTPETFSSIWSHSSRVARIAHHIAKTEGWEEEPALLAGLLHDIGKFAHGSYHEDDTPEEENAVRFAQRILSGTVYEKWLPIIGDAILSTYLEGKATSNIGRAVYDADCLDKLGNIGVVQFFAKKALRRQFLDDDVMIRTSIELTYAHHAPDTLKTETGRSLARKRKIRTRTFYTGLLEEWKELGLGEFNIIEEDIAGIVCILVVPGSCSCGGRLDRESDIRDSLKCRSVVVNYRCRTCGFQSEFSFCLPNVSGLPQKPQETRDGKNERR